MFVGELKRVLSSVFYCRFLFSGCRIHD
jgi:hypothetical protein